MTGAERIEAPAQQGAHHALVLHAEAIAGLLEELTECVDLLRDELWQLRADLAQRGDGPRHRAGPDPTG
jgi:hypothetical protein